MKLHNQAMKERYEELSIWREKQKEEREFYETKFKEAKQCLLAKCIENEQLQQQLQSLKEREEGAEMVNKEMLGLTYFEINERSFYAPSSYCEVWSFVNVLHFYPYAVTGSLGLTYFMK